MTRRHGVSPGQHSFLLLLPSFPTPSCGLRTKQSAVPGGPETSSVSRHKPTKPEERLALSGGTQGGGGGRCTCQVGGRPVSPEPMPPGRTGPPSCQSLSVPTAVILSAPPPLHPVTFHQHGHAGVGRTPGPYMAPPWLG